MHARKRRLRVAPHKVDAAVAEFRDNHLHKFRNQKGYKGVTVLADRESGEMTAISFWASEEDVHGSTDLGREAGEAVSSAGDGEGDTGGEVLEVVVDDTA